MAHFQTRAEKCFIAQPVCSAYNYTGVISNLVQLYNANTGRDSWQRINCYAVTVLAQTIFSADGSAGFQTQLSRTLINS